METVTVRGNAYDSYASLAQADLYAGAAVAAETFRGLTSDGRGELLVTATRILDRQLWQEAYDTVAERAVVANIVNASIEMAIYLADGSEMQENQTTQERFRSISAGSVTIVNYRGLDQIALRFPLSVMELLRTYLLGSNVIIAAKATGVDTVTSFPLDIGFTRGL